MYINDLIAQLKQVCGIDIAPLLFADDLALIPTKYVQYNTRHIDPTPNIHLQTALDVLSDWSIRWKMRININKSNVVLFHPQHNIITYRKHLPSHKYYIHHITSNGGIRAPLECVKSYKYLGLTLQQHLSWTMHYNETIGKVKRASALVCRIITKHSHARVISLLVNLIVRPIVAYALIFWTPTEAQFNAFDSAISTPLKRVLHLPRHTHSLSILTENAIPSTRIWHQQLTLSFIHRINHLPSSHIVTHVQTQQQNNLLISLREHYKLFIPSTYVLVDTRTVQALQTQSKANQAHTLLHKSIPLLTRAALYTAPTADISPYFTYPFPIISLMPPTILAASAEPYHRNLVPVSIADIKEHTLTLAHTYYMNTEVKSRNSVSNIKNINQLIQHNPSNKINNINNISAPMTISGHKQIKAYHIQHNITTLTRTPSQRFDSPLAARCRARLLFDRPMFNIHRFCYEGDTKPSLTPLCTNCYTLDTREHTLLHCPRYSHARLILSHTLSLFPLFIRTPLSVARIITPPNNIITSPPRLSLFISLTGSFLSHIYALHPF
jgi:hypothetical protein